MKSEHRHDLKTNELADWISNFPQWCKDNLKLIIYVSVVIVLVAGSAVYHWYNKNVTSVQEKSKFTAALTSIAPTKTSIVRASGQNMDVSYMLIKVAEELQTEIDQMDTPISQALGLIKKADTLRAELHYRKEKIQPQDLATQINEAKNAYQAAFDKSAKNANIQGLAKFGLGLCEEELGNYDQAKEIYNQILETPAFEASIAFNMATQRIPVMDEYKTQVTFIPAPEPNLPPQTLEPADANLPQILLEKPAEQTDEPAADANQQAPAEKDTPDANQQ